MIGVLAPHTCLACGVEGRLLCAPCTDRLTEVESSYYRCQRLLPAGYTCLNCPSPLSRVRVATVYTGPAKSLAWQLKLNGAQAAGQLIAHHMTGLLNDIDQQWLLVPVPTATSRSRQRGYDQARLLARVLSKRTGISYLDCLARSGQTLQHGANRNQRLQQLEDSFRIKRPGIIRGQHILLIDDVITTGATLEAAATVLHEAGAQQIEAVVFVRPSKQI